MARWRGSAAMSCSARRGRNLCRESYAPQRDSIARVRAQAVVDSIAVTASHLTMVIYLAQKRQAPNARQSPAAPPPWKYMRAVVPAVGCMPSFGVCLFSSRPTSPAVIFVLMKFPRTFYGAIMVNHFSVCNSKQFCRRNRVSILWEKISAFCQAI